MPKTAIIAGATGLTGSALLKVLLASDVYEKVIILSRRSIGFQHTKATELLVEFDKLSTYKNEMHADDIFCCLGTTIKKAKSKEAFKKVDFGYPLELAKITKTQGASRFMVVSSMGANPNSRIFYSHIKGTMEAALQEINFESLNIFRPSLLLGEREEFRFGERIGIGLYKLLSWLFIGGLKKYKGIQAEDVAKAMFRIAQMQTKGVNIYQSETIDKIANRN
ncbi:MAG: oxidoreductase [Bacteroidales bacterium]|nr:oxidoreductase [Bacteroidales bacterium]